VLLQRVNIVGNTRACYWLQQEKKVNETYVKVLESGNNTQISFLQLEISLEVLLLREILIMNFKKAN